MLSDLYCSISWTIILLVGYREIDISTWRRSRQHLTMQRSQKRRRYVVYLFLCFRYKIQSLNQLLSPAMASCHSFHPITGIWRTLICRHEHSAHWLHRVSRIWCSVSDHVNRFRTTRQRSEFSNLRSQRSRCLGSPK